MYFKRASLTLYKQHAKVPLYNFAGNIHEQLFLMKNIRILLLVLFNVSFFSFAQISLHPSVGVQIPMGKWAEDQFLGADFGTELNLKFAVSETFDFGILMGYQRFSNDIEKQKNRMFPVVATIQNRFGLYSFKPLLGLDLGIYNFYTSAIETNDQYKLEVSKIYTKVGAAPSAGFYVDLSDYFSFCAIAKYHYIYNEVNPMTYFGINIGLNIRFISNGPRYSRF